MRKIYDFYQSVLTLVKGSIFIIGHPANKGKPINTIINMFYWKFNKHFIKKDLVVNIANNAECICPFWSSYGGIIYMAKNPEYWETIYFNKLITPESIVLDVGSNIGYYSLLAAKKIKSGKVYAFDVDPRIVPVFKRNMKLNKLNKKVFFENSLISDKNGYEYFVQEQESEMSHIAYGSGNDNAKKFKTVKLDTFLTNAKVKEVRIAKIDVEGAEYKVLLGFSKMLRNKKVDYLIIELNDHINMNGSTHAQLMEYLRKYGYTIYIFNENGPKLTKSRNIRREDLNKNILAVSSKVTAEFRGILAS